MDYSEIKKRMRGLTERIIADYNEYNHLQRINKHLNDIESVVQYMEDKHILKLEKAKLAAPEFEAPVKKVSKKKATKKVESNEQMAQPEVSDGD